MKSNSSRFTDNDVLKILSLSPCATAVYAGKDLVIEAANNQIISFWGKTSSVIGMPLDKALPELEGQPFIEILQNVLSTGIAYEAADSAISLVVKGNLQTFYFDFIYQPVKDEKGNTYCILNTAFDVTERFLNRKAVSEAREKEEALHREQAINEALEASNEELKTLNEELAASIEEVAATNEELSQAHASLLGLKSELEERVELRTLELLIAQKESDKQRDQISRLFIEAPTAIAVLGGPDLVFELINKPYQRLFPGRDLMGKAVIDALPEIDGTEVWNILKGVYSTGKTYEGKEQLIPLARLDDGPIEDRYFTFIYQARLDAEGLVDGIVAFVIEVTDPVIAKNKIEENEAYLRNLVMNAHYPLTILRGENWIVEIANQQLANLWGKSLEEITGKALLELLPEIKDQPFPALLKRVSETGMGYGQEEEIFYLNTSSGTVKKYTSFYYDPIFDKEGKTTGIIVSADDITEKVTIRQLLEQSNERQQALNEELAAINEELASSNEELLTTNDELARSREDLSITVEELFKSETRFRTLVQQALIPICILSGRELLVESANDMMLNILGKTSAIIGKTFREALPELEGQPFFSILDQVFVMQTVYYGGEVHASLEHEGELRERYFNFIYQPIFNIDGDTTNIIIIVNEVTEQVNARLELQRAEEMLRFSVDAAEVGTWFLDKKTHQFIPSPKLKALFGFYADEEVTMDSILGQISEEYKSTVANAINQTLSTGVNYYVEHSAFGYHDRKLRWIRALGKANLDEEGDVISFSGVLMDITEQKEDELRKNDFIGMVSHELKTPLTSLKGYIQILQANAEKQADSFSASALDKVNKQVNKMTTLINGFLNVSRLESGKIFLEKEMFDLEMLVRDVTEETKLLLATHTIVIAESSSILVHADRDKIGAVISNLLSNAIKYSHSGTRIELYCKRMGDTAEVSVKDKGIGIDHSHLAKLFERYYRVENQQTHTISGFGIGLYLSAEIIQRHDGKIWAESEPGTGSTFYFNLPAV